MKENFELRINTSEHIIANLVEKANIVSSHILEKVGDKGGSNEGGWYKSKESNETYYVKFYENPDQSKVEFIANAIYAKLGIKAPESILLQIDSKTAIASKKIEDTKRSSVDQLTRSKDVIDGFVADTYLANWDVAGLDFDNIESNDTGFYRIDNGGVLNFRARGALKDFPAEAINELTTMRDTAMAPQAGKIFNKITEAEISQQAGKIVELLSDDFIREVVNASSISNKENIIKSLIGRKEFLKDKYCRSSPEQEQLNFTREKLNELLESPDYSPHKLVTLFKTNGGMEEIYNERVGGSNNYSVEEHTVRVLIQSDKYSTLPPNLDNKFFRVILTLHDVGKLEAMQNGGKHLQHFYTVKIAEPILKKLDYTEQEINLALAIIGSDPIGEYIQGGNLDKSISEVREMAERAKLSPDKFINILIAYYKADASAYTKDAGYNKFPSFLEKMFTFDPTDKILKFSPEVEEKIQKLITTLTTDTK